MITAVILLNSGFVLHRHSGQQGLVGTGRFAALRKKRQNGCNCASKPSPWTHPHRRHRACRGSSWGLALPLPSRYPQWFSHQHTYRDQSIRSVLGTEQSGPETLSEFQKQEELHSSISFFYAIVIKQFPLEMNVETENTAPNPGRDLTSNYSCSGPVLN